MKVFIAADHAGFEFKQTLGAQLTKAGFVVEDAGDEVLDPADDYPQFAHQAVVKLLAAGDDAKAILLCGSGQGMCIAANRVKGVRAALCWNEATARETREDNDSNVLCLPARFISESEALAIAKVWLNTPFSGATRHIRRLQEIDELLG